MTKSRTAELAKLLERQPAPFRAWYSPEPVLVFGDGQRASDPKSGLAQFGPWSRADAPSLGSFRVGIVGTPDTVPQAQAWLAKCRTAVRSPASQAANPVLFPSFPGMTSIPGFGCILETPKDLSHVIRPNEVARVVGAPNRDAAVEIMASLVRRGFEVLVERDVRPNVILVALPDNVRDAAGGGRRPTRPPRKSTPQQELQTAFSFMDKRRPEPFQPSRTLHRAIKAEGMRVRVPTQLAWSPTLTGVGQVQDDATRAWNMCTALFYKGGGIPWRVEGLSRSTCYVGISFYRPVGASDHLQTSMAQAFSDTGDGTVLRGSAFEWDPRRGPPQLSCEAARTLLGDVLEHYRKHHDAPPHRVVVHKSSLFSVDELAGMREALGDIVKADFLAITDGRVRVLRIGEEPPLRGTTVGLAEGRFLVFTRGYVPFLKLYPGLRIPHPLQVVHDGTSSITDLVPEILSLSRMNWNSADFAAAEPITLGFARQVGLVLSELPGDIAPDPSFRFYM